jgi:hypothetical protein
VKVLEPEKDPIAQTTNNGEVEGNTVEDDENDEEEVPGSEGKVSN